MQLLVKLTVFILGLVNYLTPKNDQEELPPEQEMATRVCIMY